MLEQLNEHSRRIHDTEPGEAQFAYRRAMAFLDNAEMAFEGVLESPDAVGIRERMQHIAEAAQGLAYEFYHQHGQPIDPDALNPEDFRYDYLPPGQRTRRLEPLELAREILEYLRVRLPHTLPAELRKLPR